MENTAPKKFKLNQLLRDKGFIQYRDLLTALMTEEEALTIKEVNKRITDFLSKKTN